MQSGKFIGKILTSLMRVGLLSMKKTLTLLAKRVLVTFGLTRAASATDVALRKKIQGSEMTTLIISNKEKKDIIKIVKL